MLARFARTGCGKCARRLYRWSRTPDIGRRRRRPGDLRAGLLRWTLMATIAALLSPLPCTAQGAPSAPPGPGGQPAGDDPPTVRVGGTLFADYTVVQAPAITDADGN